MALTTPTKRGMVVSPEEDIVVIPAKKQRECRTSPCQEKNLESSIREKSHRSISHINNHNISL